MAQDLKPKFRPVKELFSLPKFSFAFLQQLVAEFLASFIFLFVIFGNVLSNNFTGNAANLSVQSGSAKVAAFLAATGLTYAFGQRSGAHFNPVLTAGLMFAMKMNWIVGLIYLLLQWLAAFAAAGIIIALFPDPPQGPGLDDQLVLGVPNNITSGGYFFYVFLVSTYLVFTYLFFVYDRRPGKITEEMTKRQKAELNEDRLRYLTRQTLIPLIVGFVYGSAIAYNHPWRVLAPCMIAGECGKAWIYCVGGFLGSLAGAIFYMFIWGLTEPSVPASTNPLVPLLDYE